MTKVPPANFSPELVTTMKSALDTAVDRIERSHRTPLRKRRWRSGSSEQLLKASRTCMC
jgi:hypothetical protein